MGVLNPLMLLLGVAVAVPLILHLFQRHQGPRVVFPALRYLRRAERESARKVKLRQLLLMLLRMAAILLIAFAASRPFVRAGGIRHEPTAVVIVLDNSLSSGAVAADARVIDVLKQRALETLEAAEPEDEFWLLRAGSPDEPAYPGDAVETARRVRETEPTAAAADLADAIARARGILDQAAAGRATEIHLLSDLQRTNFTAAVAAGSNAPTIIAWHAERNATANRAVANVVVGGGIAPTAGERSVVTATVRGTTTDSGNVRLLVDGRLAAAARIAGSGEAVLTMPARPPGLLAGSVEMDADALRADNVRYFATQVVQPPTVSLSDRIEFIDAALAALEGASRIRRVEAGADVAILPGAAGVEAVGRNRAVVILPPESPLELAAVNRRLASAGIPWTYALQSSPGDAQFMMRDSSDSFLRTLQTARMRNVYALQPAARASGDSSLLRLRDGAPWAVRGRHSTGGRYILLATPLTEQASNIPTSAAMVPLLDRIVRTWAADGSAVEAAEPGAAIALPARADAVLRPDSVTEPARGTYNVPAVAGVYRVLARDSAISAFAVNPPAHESDLASVTRARLNTLLDDWRLALADDADGWRAAIYQQRLGRELWRSLLFALLVVLVVEAVIAATGGRRRNAAGDVPHVVDKAGTEAA